MFVVAGLILLLLAGLEICFLNSKGHRMAVNARISEQFGEALDRAGIQTQASPSN